MTGEVALRQGTPAIFVDWCAGVEKITVGPFLPPPPSNRDLPSPRPQPTLVPRVPGSGTRVRNPFPKDSQANHDL